MNSELQRIDHSIFRIAGQEILNVSNEKESEEYFGCNFQLNHLNVKFRKAKITPKKVGLFVTLWKRNSGNKTVPFDISDDFDYYIIAAEQDGKFGFFFFPKDVLCKNAVLTVNNSTGKRGFRVYPNWVKTENKQAEKTKCRQNEYFIDLSSDVENIRKYDLILTSN